MQDVLKPATVTTRLWRRARLLLHLIRGLFIVLIFPLVALETRRAMRQRWSRQLLTILGISLHIRGASVADGTLLVANHVSWVDILAINALHPAAFVSKSEVRRWPAVGWMAAQNDTIFLQRGRPGNSRAASVEIADRLDAGGTVALFPEGTTTDGSHVLPFHSALLQPALDAQRPIQSVALRYLDATGQPTTAPAYWGNMSLIECLGNIISARSLIAEVIVQPPLATEAIPGRRTLAATLHAQVVAEITEQSSTAPPPETPSHPQAASQ